MLKQEEEKLAAPAAALGSRELGWYAASKLLDKEANLVPAMAFDRKSTP